MKQSHIGKILTKEHKEKISKANKGCKHWNKGLTKDTDIRVLNNYKFRGKE